MADVKLKKAHNHAGVDYQPGEVVKGVSELTLKWLESNGVGEAVKSVSDDVRPTGFVKSVLTNQENKDGMGNRK